MRQDYGGGLTQAYYGQIKNIYGVPRNIRTADMQHYVFMSTDGYVYEELGELLLARGESAAAQPNFARAFELLGGDAGLRANEPERLSRLRRLGGIA
jgi:hypothetical protein